MTKGGATKKKEDLDNICFLNIKKKLKNKKNGGPRKYFSKLSYELPQFLRAFLSSSKAHKNILCYQHA